MNNLNILTANIGLGIPGMDRLRENLRAHFAFHGWKFFPFVLTGNRLHRWLDYSSDTSPERVAFMRARSNLSRVLNMIATQHPDIVVLNEVIRQTHGQELTQALTAEGFPHAIWGLSDHHADTTVSTVIASKLSAESIDVTMPQYPQMGGGAGIAGVRLKDLPVTIVGAHLANGIPSLLQAEVQALKNIAADEQAAGREIVIAGDFNMTEERITSFDGGFQPYGLRSVTPTVTCPTCLPRQFQHAFDHIFVPTNWSVTQATTHAFGSDHLAVSTGVNIRP